ncbi:MAG: prolyl oligopeptidase family serine peptidase [Tannerellaceae bacterium]|jgi:dipeptidyl aminopeptidase/acylaminoacyl peptidase|nr:prolyl oligopeptidase family serine peptidase [Tannerellaceae bacterium]
MKPLVFFLLLTGGVLPLAAQQSSRAAITVADLAAWERISAKTISEDGQWITARMEPQRGDATVYVYNRQGEEMATFKPAKKAEFTPGGSPYLLVTQTLTLEESERLKLKKTKEDRMPMDRLLIYDLRNRKEETIDSIRTYKCSGSGGWMAYQQGRKADSTLYLRTMDGMKRLAFRGVTEFFFSKRRNVLFYVSKDTLEAEPGLYVYLPEKAEGKPLWTGEGVFRQVTADEEGERLAFLYAADKEGAERNLELYLSEGQGPAKKIAGKTPEVVPPGWILSGEGKLSFSKKSERLFFGIAPQPKEKDTTLLAENRPEVHIWNWNEGIQYTQQDYEKAEELKKSYTVAYNLGAKNFVTLTTPERPLLHRTENTEAPFALVTTTVPYDMERMWQGASRADVYLVHLPTGATRQLLAGTYARVRLSPQGKYAYWYNPQDSSWYTYATEHSGLYRLTGPETFAAWNDDHDVPGFPPTYGSAGWTTDDQALLLYDRFDLWRFHPEAKAEPVNLTVNGREEQITYRLIPLDEEAAFVDPKQRQLLSGFHLTSKGYGYYATKLTHPSLPETLLSGPFLLSTPVKAQKADVLVYTSERYDQYPDLHLSDLGFRQSVRLTHGFRQQERFRWGTAELISWLSLEGELLEGVVYKPEDFDPGKKYPLLVNFYERNSETLHAYRMPEVHRSTVDYHFYNSHGYIVFNPDVRYKEGYPGESCFNSVIPGVAALIAGGYVEEKAIGVQGHSWGGYQDAYLATRTRLFAAIESGAPVVNMFSAYGGIRWGSGLNRSFQYERGQSRIGLSIWESPLRYLENSPLFTLDKVETPILIMANDKDGHVPWYQGIEFFIGLKRLGKPAWLLNYTGEPHWPTRLANKMDFQRRMFQFFEHYLRHKPMPQWMSTGVRAVDRDFDLGYSEGD